MISITYEFPGNYTDWELLCVHLYLRIMIEQKNKVGKEEYNLFLQKFNNDKAALDAWLYRLKKHFEYEFNTRHQN